MAERDTFVTVANGDQLNQGFFNLIRAIDANGMSTQTADFNTASTTYTDVTNPATLTLTTTKTCTIMAIAVLQTDITGGAGYGRLVIDGTAQRGVALAAGTGKQMILLGRKTGVAAGSIEIKAQVATAGSDILLNYDNTSNQEQGSWIMAIAIIE